jgi:hypothetical protein
MVRPKGDGSVAVKRIRGLPFLVTASILLAGALIVRGGASGANATHDDPAASHAAACPRAVVSSGLGLAWKRLNHRISYWSLHPNQQTCPSAAPAGVTLTAGNVGGDWSTGVVLEDTPLAHYRYFAVDGGGRLGFAAVDFELAIDPPGYEAKTPAEVPLASAGLAGFADYAVLLQGLTLTTDAPQPDPDYPVDYDRAQGYASRGLGAGVADLAVVDGRARFTVWARFELGPADRPAMNRAMRHARTRARVYALLVGLRDAALTHAEHGYTLRYDPPRRLLQRDYRHASPEQQRFAVAGRPGFPVAFLGLESFDFRLFGGAANGDYLRELSVQAKLVDYNPATGAATVVLDGFASNASWALTYETMINKFSARLALVQLSGGEAQQREKSFAFRTGETTVNLP